jgi:hypothetical protein
MSINGGQSAAMEVKIPFTQMTTEELFVVLTGGNGIMAQISLQDIVEDYRKKYGEISDLVTMVHKMADETKG